MAGKATAVSILFGIVFVALAGLAAQTAAQTTGPWFTPAISLQVYSVSLLASIGVAIALAAIASFLVSRFDEGMRSLDLRIAALPEAAGLATIEGVPVDFDKIPPTDEQVDELLHVLHNQPSGPPVAEIEITNTLMDVNTAITANKSRKEFLKVATRQRADLATLRARVPHVVAPPILAAVAFAGVAGAMLPAADGFATTNFQLNTGLILFLSYGWAILVAWAGAAFAMLHGRRS